MSDKKCFHCFPNLQQPESLQGTENELLISYSNTDLITKNPFNPLSNNSLETEVSNETKLNKVDNFMPQKRKKYKKNRTGENPANANKSQERPHLIILSDSHGRDLGHLIQIRSSVNVCCHVRPNAGFTKVTEDVKELTSKLGKNDHVLVIAGTNDMESTASQYLVEDVLHVIRNTQHTNLILATVPMRYDTPHLDLKISMINAELESIADQHPNVNILPLHILPRHFHTNHGLHLNRRGKANIAIEVSRVLLRRRNGANSRTTVTTPVQSNAAENGITVLECDMDTLMTSLKNDSSVAFSHTISADVYHPRNMSAGIAVCFKQNFGRPRISDFIKSKLTCQEKPNNAVVYSLVTKHNYWSKPTKENYSTAFAQLSEDFKQRGLKTLICSAMGCVRDNIELQLFARSIVQFQLETKSNVKIISYKEESARVLRRGLSHHNFIKQLKEKIEKEKGFSTRYTDSSSLEPACNSPVGPRGTAAQKSFTTSRISPLSLPTPSCSVKCDKENQYSVSEVLQNIISGQEDSAPSVNTCPVNSSSKADRNMATTSNASFLDL